MENRENQNKGREDDLSKAQNQQQPRAQERHEGQYNQAQHGSGQAGHPQTGQSQQSPFGEEGQTGQSFGQQQQQQQPGQPQVAQSQQQPSGQADYGSAGQSDSATQQRSDIEGGTATGQANASGDESFLGNKKPDASSELIEDKNSADFSRDGQGASE